jgi:hypothetical protein
MTLGTKKVSKKFFGDRVHDRQKTYLGQKEFQDGMLRSGLC